MELAVIAAIYSTVGWFGWIIIGGIAGALAGLAGSACGFDAGGFWRAGSSRPMKTRTGSAKLASVRYGRKDSVAGATAAPFTARISRTPTIKATLITDAYPCCSLVRSIRHWRLLPNGRGA